ncbi:MAG: glycoside hydrolase family 32 protein [Solobacterium sp.]|nr:glycoside hydrolase family 32 protein [Solobacterium sp.]
MISEKLLEARNWEVEEEKKTNPLKRPVFHLSSRVGWMNDPNGFSIYNGEIHLFYQHFPYKSVWGPMHWAHAVSKDFVTWEYLPEALAPDTDADNGGCFSGSAVTLKDGKHMLMYTGVVPSNVKGKMIQTQCLAFGDGINYTKYENNPILTQKDLPQGLSAYDFRDPKMNVESDGSLTAVIGGCKDDMDGRILYYGSQDGIHWNLISVLAENNHRFGTMWECPDFFELDGKKVLLCSPMNMVKDDEYSDGHGTLCLIGELDENNKLVEESNQAIDYGVDFYATQTLLAPDGRRIMVAWMQSWHTLYEDREDLSWYGLMTLPRELSIRNGRLYQQPVREIEGYRTNKVSYEDVEITYECELRGVEGRSLDLNIDLDLSECDSFLMKFAKKDDAFISLLYDSETNDLTFDRSNANGRVTSIDCRSCKVRKQDDYLSLRILMDKYSFECFINDGEQTLTFTYDTNLDYKGISFSANGMAKANIVAYTLEKN